jgi:hypothetical protein
MDTLFYVGTGLLAAIPIGLCLVAVLFPIDPLCETDPTADTSCSEFEQHETAA